MADKVEKIREEVERMHNLLPVMDGDNISVNYADRICTTLEMYIDSMQEEPASKELEKAARDYSNDLDNICGSIGEQKRNAFKAGAKWQKANLWKSADGNDLPEIDNEVIALLDNGEVVFAHRLDPKGWDGKSITTGKVEHYTPKTYDKGGWNIPNVRCWLDVLLPKEIEL